MLKVIRIITITLLILFLTLSSVMCKTSEDWNKEGIDLYKQGKYEEAIKCFNKALEIEPKASEIWFNKGKTYYKIGKNEEALECFNKAIEYDPNVNYVTLYNKGICLNNLFRYEEAIKCFNKILENNSADPDAKKAKAEAEKALEEQQKNKEAEDWFKKGQDFFKQGMYEKAIMCYDEVLKINPNYPNGQNKKDEAQKALTQKEKNKSVEEGLAKGQDLLTHGKYEEAAGVYDKVLEIDPGNTTARSKKAEAQKALEEQQKARTIEDGLAKGNELFSQEKYQEAIEAYTKVLEIDPNNTVAKNKKDEAGKALAEQQQLNASNMVLIPSGSFIMGSSSGDSDEKPVHTVQLNSFYMGKYEITNAEFCAFLNSQGNQNEGGKSWINITKDDEICGIEGGPTAGTFKVKAGHEKYPVVSVTWYGTAAYCNWLSEKYGLTPCYGPKDNRGNDPSLWRTKNGYRLPTEAEWEYACRAGTTTDYYWGGENADKAPYCLTRDGILGPMNPPVETGGRKPNSFGLYDMSGNALEWCSDWKGNYPDGSVTNPAGPLTGTEKILRGGSGYNRLLERDFIDCRSANRISLKPDDNDVFIGFRIVKNK